MNISVKKLHDDARLPKFQKEGDVCADLHAVEDKIIFPRTHAIVRTGIAIGLPLGWEAQVRARSGLAAKHGISLVNSPGTIDSGYRGEIMAILMNNSDIEFLVKKGDRVDQLGIRQVPEISFVEVDQLDETERGSNGLGSTGVAVEGY